MTTRTVTLELLRHGPAHNQLLSPLTPYLALCGNHDAETVHVGFEHLQFERRLRELRYVDGHRAARSALQDAAAEVSRLAASIRSLAAELSSARRDDRRLVHVRLVLSASELALLPFELIESPAGFPGQGQPLSLQAVTPIALTREVRRVTAATVNWPEVPRLLVIAASPRGVSPVPLRAHLLAIRRALAPWLRGNSVSELEHHVTVLPRASLAQVREVCTRAQYTHVHVLAHGYASTERDEHQTGYGLALHADGADDKIDVVSGTRLAAALRCHPGGGADAELPSPVVVTVASCDSGNVGSVIAHGASVAHDLHEAGVPLVLASQFPLSVRGSAVMADLVYRRLLRGDDPRLLVHDLRQELLVASPDTHDWASIVAYAALPVDIDAKVKKARFQRARRAVNTVMARMDAARDSEHKADRDALDAAMAQFEAAMPLEEPQEERAHAYGLLASAKKRAALLRYDGAPLPLVESPSQALPEGRLRDAPEALDDGIGVPAPSRRAPSASRGAAEAQCGAGRGAAEAQSGGSRGAAEAQSGADTLKDIAKKQRASRAALGEARSYYMKTFRLAANQCWALVQWLGLTAALDPMDGEGDREEYANRWTAALVLAEDGLYAESVQHIVWAQSSLIELGVLAQLLPPEHAGRGQIEKVDGLLDDMLDLLETDPYKNCRFDAYSLLRQLLRYSEWWWQGRSPLDELPRRLAEKMQGRGVQARWEFA